MPRNSPLICSGSRIVSGKLVVISLTVVRSGASRVIQQAAPSARSPCVALTRVLDGCSRLR
jgi:hypothetical protein